MARSTRISDAAVFGRAVQLHQAGRLAEASALYRKLPGVPDALNNLGVILLAESRIEPAIRAFREALRRRPTYLDAQINLGNALKDAGQETEAIGLLSQAVEAQPGHATASLALSMALRAAGRLAEALGWIRRCLALTPSFVEAHNNLATANKDRGRAEDALLSLRRALAIRPDLPTLHANLLMTLQYAHTTSEADLVRAGAAFDRRLARTSAKPWAPLSPAADRPLRVGYVSADFGHHPVGFFLAPVIASHDRSRVVPICYSARAHEDELTRHFRRHAAAWRPIAHLGDEALAERIRSDRIDVLVDLAGHTAGNRLGTFALKPAPLQATWIGWAPTGLSAIEWFIADRHTWPATGAHESTVLKLPDSLVCYGPPAYAPPVAPLPALTNGYLTFSCFNNLAKVTPQTLATWARILAAVPNSRIVLKAGPFRDASTRDYFQGAFADGGIERSRVDLLPGSPHRELLAAYGAVDVALDPFPFSGGVSTCEALWMGVPVVTIAGTRFVGRTSTSYLRSVGLDHLVAIDIDSYRRIAVDLAGDVPRLAELRGRLRDQMASSPLCDGPRFARHLEEALHAAWRSVAIAPPPGAG